MFDPVLKNPWVRFTAAVSVLVAAVLLVLALVPVLTPVLLAFLVAYALHPVVVACERRRAPRMVTILLLLGTGVFGALLLPVVVLPEVIGEADRLVRAAGSAPAGEWAEKTLEALPLREIVQYLGWAPADPAADFDERAILAERLGAYIKGNALQFVRGYGDVIAGAGQTAGRSAAQIIGSAGSLVLRLAGFFFDFSLFLFVAAYLMRDFEKLVEGARSLLPPRARPRTEAIFRKIDTQLHSFLRGQLTVCACLMVLYGAGLLVAGTPFAVPIALVGGAASIIPYVGPTVTVVPAALMTLLYYGPDHHLLLVFGMFALVQLLESYILTPRIVGKQVGLNPVWVIVSILVFTSLLGALGTLLAVPLAAVLKVLILEGVEVYRRSSVFTGDSSSAPPPASAS